MRFFLDHDVPVSVRSMLSQYGHECWTAGEAGLATEGQDDNLTVYASSRSAVLITLDKEFSQRRLKNPIGRHIWLHCPEPRASLVLAKHLAEVLELLQRENVTIKVTRDRVRPVSKWD